MKFSIICLFLLQVCYCSANDGIRLFALARHFEGAIDKELSINIKDGYVVNVVVVNDSSEVLELPSANLTFEVIEREHEIDVEIGYHVSNFVSKSGTWKMIPSHESFMPVKILKGECMAIGNPPFTIEKKMIGGRPVLFKFRTVGFLSERLGFSPVDLTSPLILRNFDKPPELREP